MGWVWLEGTQEENDSFGTKANYKHFIRSR